MTENTDVWVRGHRWLFNGTKDDYNPTVPTDVCFQTDGTSSSTRSTQEAAVIVPNVAGQTLC